MMHGYIYAIVFAFLKIDTLASVASLEKIEILRSEEFMLSKARLKFLKKMIILGPKTAILGPQFCRIWCWGLIFSGRGGSAPTPF